LEITVTANVNSAPGAWLSLKSCWVILGNSLAFSKYNSFHLSKEVNSVPNLFVVRVKFRFWNKELITIPRIKHSINIKLL
jgi:hypothetical protein